MNEVEKIKHVLLDNTCDTCRYQYYHDNCRPGKENMFDFQLWWTSVPKLNTCYRWEYDVFAEEK